MREQRVILENDAHVAPIWRAVGERCTAEQYLARARGFESREHHQRRRLARSRRAKKRQEFAALDRKIKIGDGDGIARGLTFLDAAKLDERGGEIGRASGRGRVGK